MARSPDTVAKAFTSGLPTRLGGTLQLFLLHVPRSVAGGFGGLCAWDGIPDGGHHAMPFPAGKRTPRNHTPPCPAFPARVNLDNEWAIHERIPSLSTRAGIVVASAAPQGAIIVRLEAKVENIAEAIADIRAVLRKAN